VSPQVVAPPALQFLSLAYELLFLVLQQYRGVDVLSPCPEAFR
jgi:hypothetical protein